MIKSAPVTTARKQLQRDKAAIQAEVRKLDSPKTSESDKTKAVTAISKVVLKGTGQSASPDTGQMLGRLTVGLIKDPLVVDTGIKDAIKSKVSPEDAASIPVKVVERLKKLV